MKNYTLLFVFILFSIFFSLNSNAQSSLGMTYQAVVRNAGNALVANTVVGVRLSIIQTTATGTVVYAETHSPTTNINGLVTFNIGAGAATSGFYFLIDWANGPYYLKTEIDPAGGTNYSISNIAQFMSVPYAQFAYKSADSGWGFTGNDILEGNFIGTTNNFNLIFKRNNVNSGFIGLQNVALGRFALNATNPGNFNVAIGADALPINTGSFNVATGFESQQSNVGGIGNTSYGFTSLKANTSESYNTAIGFEALKNATGGQNTAIGWDALINLSTGGGNIGIGRFAAVATPTANNQLSIANVIYGTDMGNTTLGKIGIGVPVPTERLEVDGKTKTTNLQVTAGAGINKVLTSDATGNATWQNSNANTGISVRKSFSQTIPNAVDTKIDFSTEITDDGNAFDATTDEWTVQSNGFYHAYASMSFLSIPVNQTVVLSIYVNGTLVKFKRAIVSASENFDISLDLKLITNDKVTVYVYQTSGSGAVLSSSIDSVYFTGYKIY